MKIRSLNNATILLKSEKCSLLIDPWLVGNLYGGAWSPYATCHDLDFLKTVTHVFISHIHEDHWDRETLDLLDRKVQIFIPELPINNILKRYIEELGFSNVKLIKPYVKIKLADIILTIVPPLNAFGQELGSYVEGYELDATNIDTSLFVEDQKSNTSHLFLCDNTPYDIQSLEKLKIKNLDTLWYPFNSYAQDYPVCYKLTDERKKDIHISMHNKRKAAVEKCVKALKPKLYFPHSADFVLNGPNGKAFEAYISEKYIDRKLVADTYSIQNNTLSKSEYVNFGDEIIFYSHKDIQIKRNLFSYDLVSSKPSLDKYQSLPIENEVEVLEEAFSQMLKRCDKLKIDLSPSKDWLLKLVIEHNEYIFSYQSRRLLSSKELNGTNKILTTVLSKKQFAALMSRELHWNNAQIGFHLQFERTPNEYCKEIYKSLNFLHM